MAEIESEKKRLIDILPSFIDLSILPKKEIEQFYIKHPDIGSARMRAIDGNKFLVTKKYKDKNVLGKVEIEEEISQEEYKKNRKYMMKSPSGVIKKTRYHLSIQEEFQAELDIFHGPYKGIIFIEIEFDNIHSYSLFKKPKRFGKNISGMITNKSLFLKGPKHAKKHIDQKKLHPVVKRIKKINRKSRRKLLKLHKKVNK